MTVVKDEMPVVQIEMAEEISFEAPLFPRPFHPR